MKTKLKKTKMKISKLKTVVHTGSKDWNGKTLEKYLVVFENEENGTLTVFPNQPTPEIGNEMEYEIVDNGYGNEVKPKKKPSGGGGFSKWTPEQVAQQDAIKLTCAFIEQRSDVSSWKQFFTEAREFMLHTIKANQPPADEPQEQKSNVEPDKLPFD